MAEGSTVQALWKVTKVVLDTLDFNEVVQKICDSLLTELGYLNLGYRIIVLSLYKDEDKSLHRVALSQTPEAEAAKSVSTIPFHQIAIPVTAVENLCARAFVEQKDFTTQDWKDILSPPLMPDDARNNQRAAGIKTSMIFPIIVKGKSVGVVIFSMVKDATEVAQSEFELIRGFTEIVGIAVQNAKLYSDLEITTESLDKANKKLLELDHLKDEFISIASHELRSPAAVVKNYIWSALNGAGNLPDQARQDLVRAQSANVRLVNLVNDLLDVSRIESGRIEVNPEKFDLNMLIRETIEEYFPKAADKPVQLVSLGLDGQIFVMADKNKIHQVIANLVDNAIKFTPAAGKVTVSVEINGNNATVKVVDTGVGIGEADMAKLFTKFGRIDTTKTEVGRTQGTGLGLYISKRIVELCGGQMKVESVLGKGSTFGFSLTVYNGE